MALLCSCSASIVDRDWIATLAAPGEDGANGYRFHIDETYVRLSSATAMVPEGSDYCVVASSSGVFTDLGDRVLLDEKSVLYYRFEGGRLLLEPPAGAMGNDPSFYEVYNAVQRKEVPDCRKPGG